MTDNTQAFKWTGINAQGKRVDGVLHATDLKTAQSELGKMQIEVISLSQQSSFALGSKRKPIIKHKDILLFTRFLATMIAAGLPIIQALDLIGNDQENSTMKSLIESIKHDISGGKTLAETFSQHPKYFNELYVNLIKAGEKSGTLDKMLNRLASYMEKSENMKRKIKKALTYPIAIVVVAMGVSSILLFFVVPQFQTMFSSFGAKLPYFTQLVVHLSNFLRSYWWIIAGVIVFLIVLWKKKLKYDPAMIERVDRLSLKIYVVGPILQKGIIARFTRTLSTTLEAGMPIVESMKSMAYIMNNTLYTRAVLRMCDDINSGHTLSASISASKLFPNMVVQMVSVGEASGRLSDMLNKVADYYEDEVNGLVDNLSALLEPIIMVVLGVIVGGFIIAMYLPIFKLGQLF